MTRILFFFVSIFILNSCSEGDIINTEFNFTATPEDCFNGDNFVIYKIDPDANRVISLNFTSTTFEVNQVPDDGESETITLNGTTNVLTYRKFDSPINGDEYFCSSVPPGNISVTEELVSSSGTASISYSTVDGQTVRNVTLSNITFKGTGVEIRQELFDLGSYVVEVTVP